MMNWDKNTTKRAAVFEALGRASLCWDEAPNGVFNSEDALELGNELIEFLDIKDGE